MAPSLSFLSRSGMFMSTCPNGRRFLGSSSSSMLARMLVVEGRAGPNLNVIVVAEEPLSELGCLFFVSFNTKPIELSNESSFWIYEELGVV